MFLKQSAVLFTICQKNIDILCLNRKKRVFIKLRLKYFFQLTSLMHLAAKDKYCNEIN